MKSPLFRLDTCKLNWHCLRLLHLYEIIKLFSRTLLNFLCWQKYQQFNYDKYFDTESVIGWIIEYAAVNRTTFPITVSLYVFQFPSRLLCFSDPLSILLCVSSHPALSNKTRQFFVRLIIFMSQHKFPPSLFFCLTGPAFIVW